MALIISKMNNKIIPYLLIGLMFACNFEPNSASKKDSTINKNNDTVVGVVKWPTDFYSNGCLLKEYFLIIKGDSSNYSLFMELDTVKDVLYAEFIYQLGERVNKKTITSDSIAYTSSKSIGYVFTMTFDQQIKMIDLTLKEASKSFDFNKLKVISFSILEVDGMSERITREYISKYGKDLSSSKNDRLESMIFNSDYVENLNNILSKYKIKINEVLLDGIVYYLPDSTINLKKVGPDYKEEIFDAKILFKISKKE
jgi:hypothetical protein